MEKKEEIDLEKEEINNNINNISKEKEDSEIEQINNIENIKNNLSKSNSSFLSEDGNEKLNKIFGQYPYGIESLISQKIKKDDVFLALIFRGTSDFVHKYIHSAKRKDSFAEDIGNDEKVKIIEMQDKSFDDGLYNDDYKTKIINDYKNNIDKNNFIKYFEKKIDETQKFIKVL